MINKLCWIIAFILIAAPAVGASADEEEPAAAALSFKALKIPGGGDSNKFTALRALNAKSCIVMADIGQTNAVTINKRGKGKAKSTGTVANLGFVWLADGATASPGAADSTTGLLFMLVIDTNSYDSINHRTTKIHIAAMQTDSKGMSTGKGSVIHTMTAPAGRYLSMTYTDEDFRATGKAGSAAVVFRKVVLKEVGTRQYITEKEEFLFMEVDAEGQALTGAQLIKHNWAGGAWHNLKIYRPFWTGTKWFIPYVSIDSGSWMARAYLAIAPSAVKAQASPPALKQKLVFSLDTIIYGSEKYEFDEGDALQFLPLEITTATSPPKAPIFYLLAEVTYTRFTYGLVEPTRYIYKIKKTGKAKGKPVEVDYPAQWDLFYEKYYEGHAFSNHWSKLSQPVALGDGRALLVQSRSMGVYNSSPEPTSIIGYFHQVDLLALNPNNGKVETLATCRPASAELYEEALAARYGNVIWLIQRLTDSQDGALFCRYDMK